MVVSVPEPPGRFKRARLGATRLRAGPCTPPSKARCDGSAPDVFPLDHPDAGILRLRRRPADPCVRANEVRAADRHPPRYHV